MDKMHFYERLMRWQHLRFNDVILRERPDTPAQEKKYEIYIQDKTRSSAQLYIRTTQAGENMTQVMEQYLGWLNEFNENVGKPQVEQVQENTVPHRTMLKETYRRVAAAPSSSSFPAARSAH